jgi:hypothetical protein
MALTKYLHRQSEIEIHLLRTSCEDTGQSRSRDAWRIESHHVYTYQFALKKLAEKWSLSHLPWCGIRVEKKKKKPVSRSFLKIGGLFFITNIK